jgi:hypothetical protein
MPKLTPKNHQLTEHDFIKLAKTEPHPRARTRLFILHQLQQGQIYAAELLLLDQADIDACMLFRPSETKKHATKASAAVCVSPAAIAGGREIWQRLASADELMHADIQALLAWQPNSDRRYYRCLRLSIRRPFCSGIQAAVRFFAF